PLPVTRSLLITFEITISARTHEQKVDRTFFLREACRVFIDTALKIGEGIRDRFVLLRVIAAFGGARKLLAPTLFIDAHKFKGCRLQDLWIHFESRLQRSIHQGRFGEATCMKM